MTKAYAGCAANPSELAESHRWLVFRIVRPYRGGRCSGDDLVGEGNVGLVVAARRFDPSRGYRFSTYASWWIRKFVLAALDREEKQDSIPLPTERAASSTAEPGPRHRVLSLEAGRLPGRGPSAAGETPEQAVLRSELEGVLGRALEELSPLEREVLRERFGFDDGRGKSLKEIADRRGCSSEWVRQVERRALARAKRRLLARPLSNRPRDVARRDGSSSSPATA